MNVKGYQKTASCIVIHFSPPEYLLQQISSKAAQREQSKYNAHQHQVGNHQKVGHSEVGMKLDLQYNVCWNMKQI